MAKLSITFVAPTFPDGAVMTPNEFAAWLFDNVEAEVDSGTGEGGGTGSIGITGQVGGTRPTKDIGPWFNVTDHTVELWDDAKKDYTPIANGIPIGGCIPWSTASATPPSGWLICDGSLKVRADYPDLYSVIGDLWAIDGDSPTTTFRLPDFRSRVPVGAGTGQPDANHHLSAYTMAAPYVGAEFARNEAKPADSVDGVNIFVHDRRNRESFSGIFPEATTASPELKGMQGSVLQPGIVMQWIIRYR